MILTVGKVFCDIYVQKLEFSYSSSVYEIDNFWREKTGIKQKKRELSTGDRVKDLRENDELIRYSISHLSTLLVFHPCNISFIFPIFHKLP